MLSLDGLEMIAVLVVMGLFIKVLEQFGMFEPVGREEVYEVEIEELYDGMFWLELDGCVPEKRVSNNTAVSSTFLFF
ncbi:Kv channel-interacting protein 2 isoform X4 [Lates japonicus]|uniref:Kv channel-interacting protein 2 isoform X4 n=1 Tax=Lates japonicus TaxID=270547 RepID=A0AAD3NJC4_LATJO|nr:Kv channel-interacting protein 2 isoform X4 [Lates japonicus]